MKASVRLCMILGVVGLMAACAGRGATVDHSEVYLKHAGEPVSQVRFERVRSWRTVSREMILINFGARGEYLIELGQECHSRLHANPRMRLDSRQPNVLDVTDWIVVDQVHRCRILSIRRVDMSEVRSELANVDDGVIEGEMETAPPEGNH